MINNIYHYQQYIVERYKIEKNILTKHQHILQANQSCRKTFSKFPIIAFRKYTSMNETIAKNAIHNNKLLIKNKNNHHTGKCVPYVSKLQLCCQEIISAITFRSSQTKTTFKFYHNDNCKISFVVYLIKILYMQHSIRW